MKESDLYIPVRDWLLNRGYEVHCEIFDADIVAVKDEMMTVVELKPCLSEKLYFQLCARAVWADYVIGAIGSEPRITRGYTYQGFGLLIVRGGKVRQKHKPRPQPWHRIKARTYRFKKLTGREPAQPHEVAGLPSCPALKEQRLKRLTPEAPLTFASEHAAKQCRKRNLYMPRRFGIKPV